MSEIKEPKSETFDLRDILRGTSIQESDPNLEEMVTARLILDCHCLLGEGIIYDDERNAVMWTDIVGKKFHVLHLAESNDSNNSNSESGGLTADENTESDESKKIQHSTYNLPKQLCAFALLKNHNLKDAELPLLCAWDDGFQFFDVVSGRELSEYSQGEFVHPGAPTRLNDGRTAPNGKYFVCGGFFGEDHSKTIKVFKVEIDEDDGNLKHEPIGQDMKCVNSICWSLNGNTMYMTDSPTKEIVAYNFDSDTGKISNGKPFHVKSEDIAGVPDGSVVDSEGYLWNALFRSGKGPGMVHRIDPDSGKVVYTVHMPDSTSQTTCCCLGGKNLDILFVTSAGKEVSEEKEPHAGGIYAIKLPFKGLKESRFDCSKLKV